MDARKITSKINSPSHLGIRTMLNKNNLSTGIKKTDLIEGVKFVFFGTDSIAIPVLDELEKFDFIPVGVVCGEDMLRDRGMKKTSPPVKLWAENRNIKILQPKVLDNEFLSEIKSLDIDFAVVASYGKIIPKNVLETARLGFINVHPSCLPEFRGPAPIEYTILEDKIPAVSIMKLDDKMDHGPVFIQKEFPELKSRGYNELEITLGREGGRLLADTLPNILTNEIIPQEQDHSKATFTKKVIKEDALIDLKDNPEKNLRKILAFEKWPIAYFIYENSGKKIRIKIKSAHIENGSLVFDRVIPESKKEMNWKDFIRGQK